jgi:predicted PurR-regulated permease PerM
VVVVLTTTAVLWLLWRMRHLLFLVLIAFFVSLALEPAVQRLERRGWRRGVATGVVLFASIILVLVFVASLVPIIASQSASFIEQLPDYLTRLQEWAQNTFGVDLSLENLQQSLQDALSNLGDVAGDVAGGIIGVGAALAQLIFDGITVALFAFYLVADGPRWRRVLLSFIPPEQQRRALWVWETALDKTGGYLYSRTILALFSAVYTWAALTIIGVPFAVVLGVIVGVLSQFIPVFGTYIAAIVPTLVALFNDPIDAVWVLVALLVYQQIENLWIAPRITARTMSLHPAVAVGAVIGGIAIMGPLGAILSLPVTATIQAVASTWIQTHDVVMSDRDDPSSPLRPADAELPPESEPVAEEVI